MKPVISITDRAALHLREVLATRASGSGLCLRLVADSRGHAGLVLDRPKKKDSVVEIDGMQLLLPHPLLAPIIQGATLDYPETSEGPLLTLATRKYKQP